MSEGTDAFGAYPIIQFAVGTAIAILTVVASIMGLRGKKTEPSEEQKQMALFAHLTPTLDMKLEIIGDTCSRIENRMQRLEDRIEKVEGNPCLFVPEFHGPRRR